MIFKNLINLVIFGEISDIKNLLKYLQILYFKSVMYHLELYHLYI